MHYILYQITNKLNGKIYVGVHKTKSLDDGYMGSGKVIRSAIAKHGIENFEKVILETFENAEAMYAREAELVNETFLSREDVYNLRRGGHGGFDHINKGGLGVVGIQNRTSCSFEKMVEGGRKGGLRKFEKHGMLLKTGFKDADTQALMISRAKEPSAIIKRKESFSKIKHQSGNKNSQFGTRWITDGSVNKKIKISDDIPNGWRLGRK